MPESRLVIYVTDPYTVAGLDSHFDEESVHWPPRIPLTTVRGQNRADRIVRFLRAEYDRATFELDLWPPDTHRPEQTQIARQIHDAKNGAFRDHIKGLAEQANYYVGLVMDDPADLAPLADIDRRAGQPVQEPSGAGRVARSADSNGGAGTPGRGSPKLDKIPPLDKDSGQWVSQVVAARKLIEATSDADKGTDAPKKADKDTDAANKKVEALKKARFRGNHDERMTLGVDNDGYMWRFDPDDKKTFLYYLPSLEKK